MRDKSLRERHDSEQKKLGDVPGKGDCFYIATLLQLLCNPVVSPFDNFEKRYDALITKLQKYEVETHHLNLDLLKKEITQYYGKEVIDTPEDLIETPQLGFLVKALRLCLVNSIKRQIDEENDFDIMYTLIDDHHFQQEDLDYVKAASDKLDKHLNDHYYADSAILNAFPQVFDCSLEIYAFNSATNSFEKKDGSSEKENAGTIIQIAHINGESPFIETPKNHYTRFYSIAPEKKEEKVDNKIADKDIKVPVNPIDVKKTPTETVIPEEKQDKIGPILGLNNSTPPAEKVDNKIADKDIKVPVNPIDVKKTPTETVIPEEKQDKIEPLIGPNKFTPPREKFDNKIADKVTKVLVNPIEVNKTPLESVIPEDKQDREPLIGPNKSTPPGEKFDNKIADKVTKVPVNNPIELNKTPLESVIPEGKQDKIEPLIGPNKSTPPGEKFDNKIADKVTKVPVNPLEVKKTTLETVIPEEKIEPFIEPNNSTTLGENFDKKIPVKITEVPLNSIELERITFETIESNSALEVDFIKDNAIIKINATTIDVPKDQAADIIKALENDPKVMSVNGKQAPYVEISLYSNEYIEFNTIDKRIADSWGDDERPFYACISIPKDQANLIIHKLQAKNAILEMSYRNSRLPVPKPEDLAVKREQQLREIIAKLAVFEAKEDKFQAKADGEKDSSKKQNYLQAKNAVKTISTQLRSLINEYRYNPDPQNNTAELKSNIKKIIMDEADNNIQQALDTLKSHRGVWHIIVELFAAIITLGGSLAYRTITGKSLFQSSTDSFKKWNDIKNVADDLDRVEKDDGELSSENQI